MTDDTKQDGAPEGKSASKAMLGRNGLACTLSNDRTISAFPQENGTIVFEFMNRGARTTLKLSHEAMETMTYLYFKLRTDGFAA